MVTWVDLMLCAFDTYNNKLKKRKERYNNIHKNTIGKLKWSSDTSTRKSKEAWGRIKKITKGEKNTYRVKYPT